MAGEPVIMVQIADHDWTLNAVHAACQKARQRHWMVALVSLIPVQHTAWLGTDWGYMNISPQAARELEDYQATVLDYGLNCEIVRYQYTDFTDALADAADHLNARIVFAHFPHTLIPGWRHFLLWLLNRRLAEHQRQLIQPPVRVLHSAPTLAPEIDPL